MITQTTLLLISVAYIAILFGVAYLGDRRARAVGPKPRNRFVYSLALGIYCTSWTFYGAVGRAKSHGWDFLPIYLGPAFVFLFGTPVLARIVRISKGNNITSVADFIGARYGRHQVVPLVLSLIATIGIVPYIALQLKAVSFAFDALSGPQATSSIGVGATLALAAVMAVFAILFGTRELSATENHHGMVLAVAFESLVKLIAFIAIGVLAIALLNDRSMTLPGWFSDFRASAARELAPPNFITQTVLAAFAIICLPRQFHIAVVEHSGPNDLRTARFAFPFYLLLISLFVIPITQAGRVLFGDDSAISPDTYVLALPLSIDRPWLGLAAYVGGFSAATGMVIVESIAIATMISNEIVMPLFVRTNRLAGMTRLSVPGVLKLVRRAVVVLVIVLAYLYYSLFTSEGTLTQIGLLSFAAVAQFAPSLIGGMFWKGGTYLGAALGLISGALTWAYTLLLPALAQPGSWIVHIVHRGPFDVTWLRPQALLGIAMFDPLTHGVFWSLAINTAMYVGASAARKPGLRELLNAANFLNIARPSLPATDLPRSSATVGDLDELAQRFLGADRAHELFEQYRAKDGSGMQPLDPLSPGLARAVEHALAGVIGASSARLVLSTTLQGKNMRVEDVVRLLDETSHAILFTRELMRTALEHLPQGISVVDADLKLVAWNRQYTDLFGYPGELAVVGRPIEDLIRFNAVRGWLVSADIERAIQRRLAYMRAGRAYTHERRMPNGVVLEIRGNPLPGGGFVTSYADVTAYKKVQADLQEANTSLERRVHERTTELLALNSQLARSKVELEHAHLSKTRFLAAASHDLAQPITAARLFISSVDAPNIPASLRMLVHKAEGALGSAEETLTSLLDFNRLDGGAERHRLEHVQLEPIIRSLTSDFALAAAAKGLTLRTRNVCHIVHSDAHLLRRVLQNFLSNAIRYTERGGVVVGCRRHGATLSIHVIDTGRGISEALKDEVFQEYRRMVDDDPVAREGLGLGLAIARRISILLDHPIRLRSVVGRGSNFAVDVPLGDPSKVSAPPSERIGPQSFSNRRVFCVENEPDVLAGLRSLLATWGCSTLGFELAEAALREAGRVEQPDLIIVDYHLDGNYKGLDVAARLRAIWNADVPVIVLTAADLRDEHIRSHPGDVRIMHKPLKPGSLRAVMDVVLG